MHTRIILSNNLKQTSALVWRRNYTLYKQICLWTGDWKLKLLWNLKPHEKNYAYLQMETLDMVILNIFQFVTCRFSWVIAILNFEKLKAFVWSGLYATAIPSHKKFFK